MSLLKTLIVPKAAPPQQEVKEAEVIVERKASVDVPDTDLAPNHDPEHANHAYRQHLLASLKKRNPHVYAKIMNWD
jgi:hypothetical protein